MGFGLKDADWTEPDENAFEKMPCSTCSSFDPNPGGDHLWCYCTENIDWVKATWVQGCSDGERLLDD